MADQIYIGNSSKGMNNNLLPFNIDNDAFPVMYNFYSWRGRAKRKRGTSLLGQLQLQVQMVASAPLSWQLTGPNLSAGSVNLFSFYTIGSGASISPGTISFVVSGQTYTDSSMNGILTGNSGGTGTINYATSVITISGGSSSQITGTWSYNPALPVMGLRDFFLYTNFNQISSPYPVILAFDTHKSYQFSESAHSFYNVSYYKGTNFPTSWSGENYQQFWTTNYSGALWATNNKPGFHFANGTYTSGSATNTITFNFKSVGVNYTLLTVGSKLFFNEWSSGGSTINSQTGTVSGVSDSANGNYVVTFDASYVVSGSGIVLLSNNSISGQDGIKWYDGDSTSATGLPVVTTNGWVNFSPPLTATSVNIDNLQPALYYLVGALSIVSFKDRILFFSPWVQTSSGNPIQLQDTVIWSQNGTPYYAALTPSGQTSQSDSYYVDVTGKGGYLSAGIPENIVTVSTNEDVLIVSFSNTQTRFVFTGNDFNPFLFFSINSELGASAPFSSINLDRGGITVGAYGIVLTTQQSAQRIDLDIPNNIFQIQLASDGTGPLRVSSARDFSKEWIYFSYPVIDSAYSFPTQTFLYNYREANWAILYENFTAHGSYRSSSGNTWANIGNKFPTWNDWNEPWNSGNTYSQYPSIVAGNPQGYVLIKADGTGESISGTIQSLSNSNGFTQITSNNHCVTNANPILRSGDFLYITGCLGTTSINAQVGKVVSVIDNNNFVIDLPFPSGSYLGLGKFARLSQPFLQTKQFNFYWDRGRKTRLGVQRYLLDRTDNGQITLNINLSQDPDSVWNAGSIVPSSDPDPSNNSLIYSQTIFTCPETDNLQMPTASTQRQIWHRMNTSLIGDSVQLTFTLSEQQMRVIEYATAEIALHAIQLTVNVGPMLS